MDKVFSKEEALLRGYIHLTEDRISVLRDGLPEADKEDTWSLAGNGYVTDALLFLIKKHSTKDQRLFAGIKTVDLTGCSLITDHGIKCLCDCLQNVTTLERISIEGCSRLTVRSKLLLTQLQGRNQFLTIDTQATQSSVSPFYSSSVGNYEDHLHGQVLIVPHPGLKSSLLQYMTSGGKEERKQGQHVGDWKLGDWTVALTDVTPSSCLFDCVTSASLNQVVLPFDVSLEPQDITQHVRSVISRIVAKEEVNCKFPTTTSTVTGSKPFIDTRILDKQKMWTDAEGMVHLCNVSNTESSIGVFVSNTSLTRSSPCMTIEILPSDEMGKCAVLLGCLFNELVNLRHPMDSNDEHCGYIDGIHIDEFERKQRHKVTFGVDGGWMSEYVPRSDATFFFERNGVRNTSKMPEMVDKPRCGMYPLVSVLGETTTEIILHDVALPKKDLLDQWRKENKWIEAGHTSNILVDSKGILSAESSYADSRTDGVFLGRQEISHDNNSFSVEVKKHSPSFYIGIGAETLDKQNASVKTPGLLLAVSQAGASEWNCQTCMTKNNSSQSVCKSCSTPVKFYPENKQAVVILRLGQSNPTTPVLNVPNISQGDTVTVSCTLHPENVYNVTFSLNGKQIAYEKFTFSKANEIRCVPIIVLCEIVHGPYLRLKNYKPTYRTPALYKDRVTVGKAIFLNVMDNGEIESVKPFNNKLRGYSLFVAKCPFNKQLLEFTVEIISMSAQRLFGIGLTGPDTFYNDSFIGWRQGTVGYHADNGGLYNNSSSKSTTEKCHVPSGEAIISEGSTVAVRISPVNDSTPLRFTEDGDLDSQQTVKVTFLKDQVMIYQLDYEILTESIYPALSMFDAKVRIQMFYPESVSVYENLEREKQLKEQLVKEEKEESSGTEYLVVGVASGSSDPSGKLDLVKQQLDLQEWPERQRVTESLAEMEKRLDTLDLQEQQRYSHLCAVEYNMNQLAANPGRIKYMALDMTSSEGKDKLATEVLNAQERQWKQQPTRYKIITRFKKWEESILETLKKVKVIRVSEMFKVIKSLDDADGRTVLELVKEMHSLGKLLLLEMVGDQMVADVAFMLELETRLHRLLPTEMMDLSCLVPSIGSTSHVWPSKALQKSILEAIMDDDTAASVREVLTSWFGLIGIDCIRTKPEDEMRIYVILENIANQVQAPIANYWKSSGVSNDCTVMRQTYEFPVCEPGSLLSVVISNTCKFGQVILLTSEGVVYQNGAVQTVIIRQKDNKGKGTLVVESRCYMPDLEALEETKMSKQTTSYVQEYTWNIFCIYTDIVDDLLRRSNTVVIIQRDAPRHLVNVSVGCKHDWAHSGRHVQSVCTLCNNCCDKGDKCLWNGILNDNLRRCGCDTVMVGCKSCGICVSCASYLWTVRTNLRPFSLMMTEVQSTLFEKGKKRDTQNAKDVAEIDNQQLRDPVKQVQVALDPFVFNEVNFVSLDNKLKIISMKEESSGTLVQAFPSKAAYVQNFTKMDIESVTPSHNMVAGDSITLRLSDPLGLSYFKSDEMESEEHTLEIEPQYFALQGRETRVIHETGVVLYDTSSSSIPVGQFIACKPMTKVSNTFSVRVLSTGKKGTIAMGLVPANYAPNRQPGWSAQSIGYHADDGGIFLESGSPTRRTKGCQEGDIMSFYVDFDKNKGFFRKNGEKMIELNLNPSRLGFYPCIGFHSTGESVEIIEKELWIPKNEEQRTMVPPAFATYKYGNLWISPGEKVKLNRLGNEYSGWLVLHNPKKDPVGFKVQCGTKDGDDTYFGIIQQKKNWLKNFIRKQDRLPDMVIVEWTSLESGRTYKEEDMKTLFGISSEMSERSSYQHRLPVSILESSGESEELPSVVPDSKPEKAMLCLEVFKNLRLVDKYWLKFGNYQVSVEAKEKQAKFLLRYPKSPTFNYPSTLQKGMKLCVFIESANLFAECIVVEVYGNGRSLAVEYSPKDKNVNSTICIMSNSKALQFTDFNGDESVLLPYEPRNTPASLVKTFVHAPSYLLSEGGKKVQNFVDKEPKANVLRSVAHCSQVLTRLTVQEKHICDAAWQPQHWMKNDYRNYLFAFLPQELSPSTLLYPQVDNMFKDIAVHRLCFALEELTMQAGMEEEVMWRLPLHFVDIPGIVPKEPLPLDVTYGDGLNVWTYIALISNKLYLPSYTNMIKGDTTQVSQATIEHLLHRLLFSYAALCGIYSATWGGVEYAQANEEKTVRESIRYADKNIIRFSGKPHTETDMLMKGIGYARCKAHCLNMGVSDTKFPGDIVFDYSYFEPYTPMVSMFSWSHTKLETLPEDFFQRFSNLQYFGLGQFGQKMVKFQSLPEGVSKATKLKVIEITNTAMTKLPEDFFLSPSAISISCDNMPIKELPRNWLKTSQVSSLVLSGLLLETIPDNIGDFEELQYLKMNHNVVTDLPDSLAKLTKLKELKLMGAPWLTLAGKRNQITHEKYQEWLHVNPVIKSYLGEEKVEELFSEYDFNHNKILDEEEIAAFNLRLFFEIPRFGIKDINDEVTGGIPPVVFQLKSLNVLYLDNNAITMVPKAINNLQNLHHLSLSHCPLLESLPGTLGHLPNISAINVNSCPVLRTPPIEVVSRGFESVKAYLKRLAAGFTECRRTKLMVVGLGGAGKTSLLRALMSEKKMTAGTEAEIPTDGIDIVPWTITTDDGREVTYSTWDFAGQAVYYNTHQFFLSKRAVYLLLWSMRQGYEHAGLDFWLSSICCHAPGTPILVIGTQCDLIPQAEIPVKELKDRYSQIAGFHQVSSIKGTGIADLQKNLLEVTLQQGYMGEKIPQVWLNFEKKIIAERISKTNYITWDVAKQYAMEQGIYDEKDVRMSIQFLHDLGTVQYFDNDFLRDYVVINPQWIVNVMACVVSAQDSPIQKNKGRFMHKDIPTVWKDYDPKLHQWLLHLTEDFDLTFPLPKEPVNVVPCLLPSEPPPDMVWPSMKGQTEERETKMVYRFTYLPSGLFNRAQVRLFQFSDGKMIWKKGSMLSKNKHLALIKQSENTELTVFVQGPRPENILFLIHEVFESIIEESFNGVLYEMFVPCPDCIVKEGTSTPDLLNAKLIQRAKDLKAPFLQCYKYFHWLSLALLQEKLPNNSRELSDFDVQLQQSIVALQELNNDLMVDTAIIYSSVDVPGPGDDNKLPPKMIRDDIVSWGYTCWFAEDMDHVSYVDMTTTIKNCRILLALVSDDFERDSKCRDMFLYAKETMNKDIIIVVMGESMDWQNKDLGMKIGNQERKLMAKNLKRYTVEGGRRDELKDWLDEKLHKTKVEKILPDVFLSYSWTNSKDAADRSGRVTPGAIGYADPRQLKHLLHENGINCWIDIENVGTEKQGIFADMAAGIRNSKMMLACISDEYAASENCMMELRFGLLNIELPVVVAIVGTGAEWKETEVAMLLRRAKASEVYLQKKNPDGLEVLMKFIRETLSNVQMKQKGKKREIEAAKELKEKAKTEKKKKKNNSSIAYQEEFELLQRKFMRHILGSQQDSLPLPRLIVADFVKKVDTVKTEDDGRDSQQGSSKRSRPKLLRPKTATKSRDRLQVDDSVFEEENKEDWSNESFCLRLLCEHEGGWHLCKERYPLVFRGHEQLEHFLKKAAPYLYRIYSILKQSPIKLNCFDSSKGEAYQKWIQAQSEENPDFSTSMEHIRTSLVEDETREIDSLARCRLPSGKIVWLCTRHQEEEHVVKLSTSSSSSYNTFKVLFIEDKLMSENMEKSAIYKRLKSIKSTKVAPKLPEPVPIPTFAPKAPPPLPQEKMEPDSKPEADTQKDKNKSPEKTSKGQKSETTKEGASNTSGSKASPTKSKTLTKAPSLKATGQTADLTVKGSTFASQKNDPKKKNDSNKAKGSTTCSIQ